MSFFFSTRRFPDCERLDRYIWPESSATSESREPVASPQFACCARDSQPLPSGRTWRRHDHAAGARTSSPAACAFRCEHSSLAAGLSAGRRGGRAGAAIGVAAPLSGPSAILGEQMRAGRRMAAVEAGDPPSLEVADDACTAEGGAAAAARLRRGQGARRRRLPLHRSDRGGAADPEGGRHPGRSPSACAPTA